MTYRWFPIAEGTSQVVTEEVCLNPAPPPKYRTFFIARDPRPDGTCANCRARPGAYYPRTGTYACDPCVAAGTSALWP